jgi:hypothetical protein
LESQRVWDYTGDGYVHRLIQNLVDGKLVELAGPDQFVDYRVFAKDPDKVFDTSYTTRYSTDDG